MTAQRKMVMMREEESAEYKLICSSSQPVLDFVYGWKELTSQDSCGPHHTLGTKSCHRHVSTSESGLPGQNQTESQELADGSAASLARLCLEVCKRKVHACVENCQLSPACQLVPNTPPPPANPPALRAGGTRQLPARDLPSIIVLAGAEPTRGCCIIYHSSFQ